MNARATIDPHAAAPTPITTLAAGYKAARQGVPRSQSSSVSSDIAENVV